MFHSIFTPCVTVGIFISIAEMAAVPALAPLNHALDRVQELSALSYQYVRATEYHHVIQCSSCMLLDIIVMLASRSINDRRAVDDRCCNV